MSSRLFQRIREKEGLVYTVMSYHNGYLHGGYEAVYAACAPKNLKRVLDLTLEEMRKIRVDGATAKELADAKLHLKGSILLSLESTTSRMSGIARQEYYFGRQFSPDEIIAAHRRRHARRHPRRRQHDRRSRVPLAHAPRQSQGSGDHHEVAARSHRVSPPSERSECVSVLLIVKIVPTAKI